MSLNFFLEKCQTFSKKKTFGLCDDPPPAENPAYIDEKNGENWIAVIENFYEEKITFNAIDHCVEFPLRPDGKTSKRCDGVLTYGDTVAFIELKKRDEHGTKWIDDAEKQLLVSIGFFEKTEEAEEFSIRKAYIVNSERPLFRSSQAIRMDKFLAKTGHVLRIEARVKID
jgi:hypothetical protein